MTFDSFIQAQPFFLWTTFGIALVIGALVNKTNFCTLGAIILGSALTMKVQYYTLVYEEEASLTKALVADLHLLPNALRRLDKV